MYKEFLKVLGLKQQDERNLGSFFKRLEEQCPELAEHDLKYITGLAGLLGKVAFSDLKIEEHEIETIKDILKQSLALDDNKIASIVEMLSSLTKELCGVEDHHYTRLINGACEKDEKIKIIESLFCVASSDELINNEEEHAIRIIAQELHLADSDFITARLKYKEHLSVLKKN